MNLGNRIKIFTPFSYIWLLRRCMGNPKTILDIGCGDGTLMEVLSEGRNWKVIGIDIYVKDVKKASRRKMYAQVYRGDLNTVAKRLIREGKKYDLVFCSQVIEHIKKEKGEELLQLVDKLAKKRIYMGTPRGFMNQPEMFLTENPHQIHLSGWVEEEFRKRGYKVYGTGLGVLWSENGLIHKFRNKYVYPVFFVASFLASPLVYFFPSMAAGMLCIKDLKV